MCCVFAFGSLLAVCATFVALAHLDNADRADARRDRSRDLDGDA